MTPCSSKTSRRTRTRRRTGFRTAGGRVEAAGHLPPATLGTEHLAVGVRPGGRRVASRRAKARRSRPGRARCRRRERRSPPPKARSRARRRRRRCEPRRDRRSPVQGKRRAEGRSRAPRARRLGGRVRTAVVDDNDRDLEVGAGLSAERIALATNCGWRKPGSRSPTRGSKVVILGGDYPGCGASGLAGGREGRIGSAASIAVSIASQRSAPAPCSRASARFSRQKAISGRTAGLAAATAVEVEPVGKGLEIARAPRSPPVRPSSAGTFRSARN